MAVKVTMPVLGLTMTEGKIARWLKNEGDNIKKGEPLLEIATDKIVTEVESPGEGVLVKILYKEGTVVPVKKIIGIIAAENEEIDHILSEVDTEDVVEPEQEKPKESLTAQNVATSAVPHQVSDGGRLKISPLARRVAAESGLKDSELYRITGTGPDNRIVKKDIHAYIEVKKHQVQPETIRETTVEPLSNLRSTIANRMGQSWETPHFYLETEVDVSALLEMRKQINIKLEKEGKNISITDLLVKICGHALSIHTSINVSFSEKGIIHKGEINIGVAVAISEGLIVPVIVNADQKAITQIADINKILIDKAKKGNLTMDEVSNGTFTVSNLGMFSVDSFTAIINPPEAAILSAGSIIEKPVAVNKEVIIKPCMRLNLGLDHRAIDGAQGAAFLSTLKEIIENPYLLVL